MMGRAIHRQRGVSLILVLFVLLLAAAAGGAVAYLVITQVDLKLALRDQPAKAIIAQSLSAKGTVTAPIGLRLTETIKTTVPVDQKVTIPIKDTLNIVAHFDGEIPLRMNVRLQDEIPLKQVVDLDTSIDAFLPGLGSTITIPLRGKIPIDTRVPVDLTIPVDQLVRLQFSTPVTARIDQDLTVPLRADIDANVPIDAALDVPVLNELNALIHMPTSPSDIVITQGDLTLPLRSLRLEFLDDAGEAKP